MFDAMLLKHTFHLTASTHLGETKFKLDFF